MNPNYLKIITNSFPEYLKSDVLEVFKIIPLETKYKFELISLDSYEIIVESEKLKIPVRIYLT